MAVILPCTDVFLDTFNDPDNTLLIDHTPNVAPAGFVWEPAAPLADMWIQSNTLVSQDPLGGQQSLYNPTNAFNGEGTEIPFGLTFPYRVTVLITNHHDAVLVSDTRINLDGSFYAGPGYGSRITIAVGEHSFPSTDDFLLVDVTVEGAPSVFQVLPVAQDTLQQIEVLFEATQFTVTLNGVVQAPVACPCPNDAWLLNTYITMNPSSIDGIGLCNALPGPGVLDFFLFYPQQAMALEINRLDENFALLGPVPWSFTNGGPEQIIRQKIDDNFDAVRGAIEMPWRFADDSGCIERLHLDQNFDMLRGGGPPGGDNIVTETGDNVISESGDQLIVE